MMPASEPPSGLGTEPPPGGPPPTPSEIVLESRIAEVSRATRWLGELATRSGMGFHVRHELELIAEEILANIVLHGYRSRPDGTMRLSVALQPDLVRLCFVDSAPPFDPLSHEPPTLALPLEERCPGGLGIPLVKRLADRLRYERRQGRNHLVVEKQLDGRVPRTDA